MANKGRLWQVDKRGYLINDAKKEYIDPIYKGVIDDVVKAFVNNIGDDLHSIYITGSIPRGLATVGTSDIDVFAVLEYYTEPELVMRDWLPLAEAELRAKHDIVSDIQMEIWTHGWLLDDPAEFSISAFILKTHAVCIWGIDMSPDVTNYRFSDRDIRLAIANDDIVQIEPDIQEAIEAIDDDNSADNIRYWCKRISKNMIHAMFGLVIADEAIHTRDIDISVDYILKHYPAYESEVKQAVDFIVSPTGSKQILRTYLDTFGQWLIDECDSWLDEHNPERYLEYSLGNDDEL